jgi:hypothetical protein
LDTPLTGGLLLSRIYEEAALPASVLNIDLRIFDAFPLRAASCLLQSVEPVYFVGKPRCYMF